MVTNKSVDFLNSGFKVGSLAGGMGFSSPCYYSYTDVDFSVIDTLCSRGISMFLDTNEKVYFSDVPVFPREVNSFTKIPRISGLSYFKDHNGADIIIECGYSVLGGRGFDLNKALIFLEILPFYYCISKFKGAFVIHDSRKPIINYPSFGQDVRLNLHRLGFCDCKDGIPGCNILVDRLYKLKNWSCTRESFDATVFNDLILPAISSVMLGRSLYFEDIIYSDGCWFLGSSYIGAGYRIEGGWYDLKTGFSSYTVLPKYIRQLKDLSNPVYAIHSSAFKDKKFLQDLRNVLIKGSSFLHYSVFHDIWMLAGDTSAFCNDFISLDFCKESGVLLYGNESRLKKEVCKWV